MSSVANRAAAANAGLDVFLENNLGRDLLRFTTAGSVDDGKSTLIGRLLHDSKGVYEDQLASARASRVNRSTGPLDFSLLTDGLRAEREQGITIDVAYRYFSTPRRKFIIADTPGHEQYTRNMATGASTSDLAVILIDGTKGLLPQTRRHAYISSLLGIRSVVAAVNKMDLVDFREEVFLRWQDDFLALASRLGITSVQCIPISALEGDNVVTRSERTPWYDGPTLIDHLETVPVPAEATATQHEMRFPVQYVIRPDATFRGFAGQVASGVIHPGDAVVALPSGQRTRIRSIVTYDGELASAFHPMSVTVQLEDEIDLSRGDMLVGPAGAPQVSRNVPAMVVWLHPKPMELGQTYIVKHGVRQTRGKATGVRYRVNVNTLGQETAQQLEMNDIACVDFETSTPLFFDSYSRNRTTGSFILIDPISNATVGAAMICAEVSAATGTGTAAGESEEAADAAALTVAAPAAAIAMEERFARNGHEPALFLLRGRPQLAVRLERALFTEGFQVVGLAGGAAAAAPALPELLKLTESLGYVVIFSGDSAAGRETGSRGLAGQVFDLDAINLPADDSEALRKILGLARKLRITRSENGLPPVN
jgi:sulfate adenylyltransferase large subunit